MTASYRRPSSHIPHTSPNSTRNLKAINCVFISFPSLLQKQLLKRMLASRPSLIPARKGMALESKTRPSRMFLGRIAPPRSDNRRSTRIALSVRSSSAGRAHAEWIEGLDDGHRDHRNLHAHARHGDVCPSFLSFFPLCLIPQKNTSKRTLARDCSVSAPGR